MTKSDPRNSTGWLYALAAYALFAVGCHGWVPALLQPVVLLVLGALLLALAGPARGSAGATWVRYVPLAIGISLRQVFDMSLCASAGLLVGLLAVAPSAGALGRRRVVIARALTAVALVELTASTAVGFHAEEGVAAVFSAVASALSHELELGPVFGGARVFLFGSVLLLVTSARGVRRRLTAIATLMAAAVAATAAVGLAAAFMPPFGSKASPMASVMAAQLPWIPFAVGMIAFPSLVRLAGPSTEEGLGKTTGVLAGVAIACALLGLPPAALRPAQEIVFYRPGFSNWEVASTDLQRAGPYSTGMLGSLLPFGRAMGLRVELVDTIDEPILSGCDKLVLINLKESLPAGAPAAIASWVEDGGHLIVVGDHTFLHADGDGWSNFLNEPLAATGIRFPNNSSDHLTTAFRDATVTTGWGRRLDCVPGNPHSPIIGAGLAVDWPARPIVIGRFGFLDRGRVPTEPEEQAIGDLVWNRGERLGGVVLLAEQQLGSGRVTVVGDTTGFHNIARSRTWRVTGDLLLGRDRDDRWSYWLSALVLLAFAGLALRRPAWPVLPTTVAFTTGLAAITTLGNLAADPIPLSHPDEPIVLVDTAVRPTGGMGDWTAHGHLTLISSALRVGHLPLFTSTVEHGIPPGTRVVLLSSPQVDPGAAWRERLLGWVRAGGHVILSAAHSTQSIHADLLGEIGCVIEPRVIGPLSARVGDPRGVTFGIRLQESWNLRLVEGEWTRIVYDEKTTTMASRAFGEGRVTVVTDQTFLQNRNQENENTIHPENIRFTMHLLCTQEHLW